MEQYLNRDQVEFFKKTLEKERKKIITGLEHFSMEADNFQHNQSGDESDLASLNQGLNTTKSLSEKQRDTLKLIEKSLKKITDKTYGICEGCDEAINIERLKVKVFAQYCIACREIMEKENFLRV